uniref:glycosyltransferase family 2 protein n=1 Tax=Prevotella sp. TaxID=59823 RepID=UPI00402975F4
MPQEPYTVSILVPVYGVEKYIERCARSIFEQTYHDLDIVFVDDCTPDNSIEILKRVLDDYPERKEQTRIIRHEQNRGLAAARNTAVVAATGLFLTHVDSDDWLELDAAEELVKMQVETGADIVTGQAIKHNVSSWVVMDRPCFYRNQDFVSDMLSFSIHHALWGRLIKKSLYVDNHIRMMEGANYAEDYLAMSQLAYYSRENAWLASVSYHYNCMNEQSYLSTSLKDLHKQLASAEQDFCNSKAVSEFFKTKEPAYYYRANKVLEKCANDLMWLYLQLNKRSQYNKIKKAFKRYGLCVYGKRSRLLKQNFYLCRLFIPRDNQ